MFYECHNLPCLCMEKHVSDARCGPVVRAYLELAVTVR